MPMINLFPLPPAVAVAPIAIVGNLSSDQLRCVRDTARFFGMGVVPDGDRFLFSDRGSWVHLRNGWEPLSWGLVELGHRLGILASPLDWHAEPNFLTIWNTAHWVFLDVTRLVIGEDGRGTGLEMQIAGGEEEGVVGPDPAIWQAGPTILLRDDHLLGEWGFLMRLRDVASTPLYGNSDEILVAGGIGPVAPLPSAVADVDVSPDGCSVTGRGRSLEPCVASDSVILPSKAARIDNEDSSSSSATGKVGVFVIADADGVQLNVSVQKMGFQRAHDMLGLRRLGGTSWVYAFCDDLVFVQSRFRDWLLAPNALVGIRGSISAVSGVNADCVTQLAGTMIITDEKMLRLFIEGQFGVVGGLIGRSTRSASRGTMLTLDAFTAPGAPCLTVMVCDVHAKAALAVAMVNFGLLMAAAFGSPSDGSALELNPWLNVMDPFVLLVRSEETSRTAVGYILARVELQLSTFFQIVFRRCAVLGVKGFANNALADRLEVVRLFKCLMTEALTVSMFESYPHSYFTDNFLRKDTIGEGPVTKGDASGKEGGPTLRSNAGASADNSTPSSGVCITHTLKVLGLSSVACGHVSCKFLHKSKKDLVSEDFKGALWKTQFLLHPTLRSVVSKLK